MAEINQAQLEKAVIAAALAQRCLEEGQMSMSGLQKILQSADPTAAVEILQTLRVVVDAVHKKIFE